MRRPRPFSARGVLAVALAVVAAAACGKDSGTDPQAVDGTYALQTVNGAPLPFSETQTDASGSSQVTLPLSCCSVTLASNGSYSRSLLAYVAQDGTTDTIGVVDEGGYSAKGTTVRFISTAVTISVGSDSFRETQVDTSTATFGNGRLTFAGDPTGGVGGTLVFVRK